MVVPNISAYDVLLPVFSARPAATRVFSATGEVAGTCFLLGGPFYLTAGHVVAKRDDGYRPTVAFRKSEDDNWHAAEVVDVELLPDDLAVIQLATKRDSAPESELAFPWLDATVAPLTDVWTAGYAYGLHAVRDQSRVLQRAFRGHVVADPREFEIPARARDPFAAYELSFQAPRGLSGAPLLMGFGRHISDQSIVGVVVGNSSSQMLVYAEEDIDVSGTQTNIVQHWERLNLGLAVQGESILGRRSQLLGRSLREFLAARGRLRVG
jgi:hypothetical protein